MTDHLALEISDLLALEDGSGFFSLEVQASTGADYLLQEAGSRFILEDGSGFLILETFTPGAGSAPGYFDADANTADRFEAALR